MNKKLISALLALGLCFGMTGCDKIPGMDKAKNWLDSITDGTILEDKFNQDSESSSDSTSEAPEASYDLEGAKKLLESRLKGTNADSNEDYDLPKEILFGGETYTLAWSVNVEENVEIVVEADGSVWVDVNEALVEEFPFILTAKITAPDGTSIDANFNRVIKAIERFVPAVLAEAPQENVAYKMNAYSVGKGQDLYFAGTTTNYSYYLKTTADYASATDVYAEYVEGSTEEFYLFHKLEGAEGQEVKEYINIVKSGTHINAQLSNEPVALKFSTEYGTFYRTIDGEDCVLTTDSSYGTIGGKLASEIGGNVSAACLVTQIDRSQVSAEDKLAYEVKTMELAPMFVGGGADATIALHGSRFPDVAIAWEISSEVITLNRKTLSFAEVSETTEVTLKATLTIGEAIATKEITVKVVPNTAEAILAAAANLEHNKAFGNEVTLTGVIVSIDEAYDSQYESVTFTMQVGDQKIEGYRMKGKGTEAKEIAVGYTVTCSGKFMKYNSKLEFSMGTIVSYEVGEAPEAPEAPEGSAIISFADEANRTSYDVNAQVWEQNGVKVTNNKGASTSDVKDYTNPVRFYKNSQVIVEFAGMQKIEFTCNTAQDDYASALKASIPAAEGVIVTVSENVVKVVFTAPVDSYTIEALSGGQVRVDSIAVYTSVSDDELSGEVTPPEGGEEGGEVSGVTLVEGQAYTMYLNQVTLGKELYLTGEVSGTWLATSENKADAADVYAEAANGGYKLYVLAADGAKSYISLEEYQKSNGYWGAHISFAAEGTVFSYNEAGCWAATLTNDTFFLGTYSTYNTISASASSFMKAENMGVNQFPALLVEAIPSEGGEEGGEVTPPEGGDEGGETTVTLVEGQAYTMYLNQVSLGKELYLTGEVSGTWLATSENKADAADVYAEVADGGYKLYVLAADGAKSYISLEEYQKSNGYWGAHISFAAEGTVFSYNEAGCWAATLTNDTFFLGTYSTYNTISASASSFMKAENMGVNQFPALLVEAEVGGETPDTPENPDTHEHNFVDGKCECGEVDPNYTPEGGEGGEVTPPEAPEAPDFSGELVASVPVAGTGYAFGMTQGNLNNAIYYLAGGMDGYYMATTTDASKAIATYIEETTGGYYFYTYVNGVKTYINMVVSGTHVNGAYETTASTVYTIDEAKMTLISNVNGSDYWFATRNDKTYTTMGPCAVSYNGFYGVFYAAGEKHTHNYQETVTAPTCTEDGYTTYTCECGDTYTDDVVKALGHTYVDGKCACGAEDPNYAEHVHNYTTTVTAPTCTVEGYTTYTCACGDTYTDNVTEVVPHVDENLDITCDFEGCTQRILPAADSKVSLFTANHMIIVSLSSNYYVEGVVTAVNDAKNGIFTISDAEGYTLLIRLPKNAEGVAYSSWTTNKVVEGDTIQVYGKPSKNSSSPTEIKAKIESGVLTILKHEHSFVGPTCFDAAACACGEIGDAALGHINENGDNLCDRCEWNLNLEISNIAISTTVADTNGVLSTDETYWTWENENFTAVIAKGTSTYTLYKTAKAYMQLKKLNTLTVASKNGATIKTVTIFVTNATQLGYLEAALANNNVTFTKNEAILGITVDWNSAEAFTIVNNGSSTVYVNGVEIVYEPTNSEGGETPEVPEHQHSFTEDVVAPTCTTDGYTTYTCTGCDYSYVDNTVAAAGHSFVEGICGVCGEVDPNYVPEHQHSYTGVVTEPTCTEDGFTTYTCGECGDKYTDNVVTALGHSYTDNVCGVCGAEQYKTLTIAEAIELGNTYSKNAYSTEMYFVTGKIIEVQQTYYGNVVISDGEAEILVYGIKSEDGSVQYGDFTTTKPVVGDTIKVLSVVGKYNAAQLKDARLISMTPATDAEKIAIEKAALTLEDDVLGAKDINLAVAGSIRNDVIITWAVTEGADIAVIENGVLKISNPAAETTVKVVATLACNDESTTAEFSIVVSPLAEGAAQPYEATLDFSDKNNRTTYSTSQQVWEQNGIKLTNDKASSTSNVGDYSNPARFYKSSKITIECKGMTEIVFTCSGESKYVTSLPNSIPANANYTVSTNGKVITVTFVNAVDSFVIENLSGGQVRVASMLVKGVA